MMNIWKTQASCKKAYQWIAAYIPELTESIHY